MAYETVQYKVADGIARIALNRPDKHNALNHQLFDDLDAAFQAAARDDGVSVVVLSGNGPSFCSGYDTRGGSLYVDPPNGDETWRPETALAALAEVEARYQRIWNCPKVTIARVHGNALAGGCYLQMLCDISVCADSARLGHPVRAAGLTSMPLWQVMLPLKKARYLLLSHRIVDGPTAERFDLVTMSVPDAELDATVEAIARDCVAGSDGVRIKKEGLNAALDIMGLAAAFRYHGQMNAMARLGRPGRIHGP